MGGNRSEADDKNNEEGSAWSDMYDDSILQELAEPFDIDFNNSKLRTEENYFGFDNNTGSTWIYPTNFPIRSYQFSITKTCLFKNTLVVLPTGLGKTFIAAVVMYNIYRWYPMGKVIFMAPTRPLVAQQIEACRKIMGIPLTDTAEMTGKQNKKVRREMWLTKRVFFATPQVIQSDINDVEQGFPFSLIKLVVVDEAHKAKGRYAYTEVVQTIFSRNSYFRVLALSATPGRRIEDVAEIVRNLVISHLEVRWENSIDVSPYTHKKLVKTISVPLGEELTEIRNEFIEIIDPYVRYLLENNVISGNVSNMTRGWMIIEQKRFREMSIHQTHPNHKNISQNFSVCISLYHALGLLERHGTRVFLKFFDDDTNGKESNSSSEKYVVAMNPRLKSFLDKLRSRAGPNPFSVCDLSMTNGEIPSIPRDLDFGHPKFSITKKLLLDHFEKNAESRVIVFCEYRESVLLLHRSLLQSRPLIRPRIFVGQGGTGSIRAVTQKEQIEVMNDFRSGKCNALISTSVAEEGIDVGEVDLIICFDISTKNPTRFTQRIGRTGRRKKGSVIMLATEGKEYAIVKEVLATKDKINQKIAKSTEILQVLYKNSPRLVPPEFDPKCLQTVMRIRDEVEEVRQHDKKKAKKHKNTDVATSGADVRKFFKKINLDEEEREIFCTPNKPRARTSLNFRNTSNPFDVDMEKKLSPTEDDSISINIMKANDNINWQKLLKKINARAAHLGDSSAVIVPFSVNSVLRTKRLSKCAKKFILEKNRGFIKQKYEAMGALQAISENDVDSVEDVANLKTEFSAIEDIFGSRLEIEMLLSRSKEEDDIGREQLDRKFGSLFNGLHERKFSDDVESFVEEQLKEYNMNSLEDDNHSMNSDDYSVVYNEQNKSNGIINIEKDKVKSKILVETDEADVFGDNFDLLQGESKYMSQWTQDNIKNQSTPLRKDNNKITSFFQRTENHKSFKVQEINIDFEISKDFFEDDFGELEQFHSTQRNTKSDLDLDFVKSGNKKINKKLFDNDDFDEINMFNSKLMEEVQREGHNENIPSVQDVINLQRGVESNNGNNSIEKSNLLLDSLQLLKTPENSRKSASASDNEITNLKKDPFDDDFNELIACSSSILTQIERREISQKSNDNFLEGSMIPVDTILEIVLNREKCLNANEANITNPELEDFDLNDFLEPFNSDEETEVDVVHPSQLPSSHKRNTGCTVLPVGPKNKDVIFNPVPNSKLAVLPTILIGCEDIRGNKSPEKNNGTNFSPLTSPSLFLRKTNIGKLRLFGGQESTKSRFSLKRGILNSNLAGDKENEDMSSSNNQNCDGLTNGNFEESIIGGGLLKNRKRVIESSDSEQENSLDNMRERISSKEAQRKMHQKVKRRRCEFLDDEAKVSGSESSDHENTYDNGLSQFVDNSITTDEEMSYHPSINLQAKYLQSIKSPNLLRGGFKIPAHRKYMDMSKICSQPVMEESLSAYKEDSFVVTDEDDVYDDENCEICPLEQAEAILKARRKARKSGLHSNETKKNTKKKKWRNLMSLSESSDDDGS